MPDEEQSTGSAVTIDGSVVEMYRRVPPTGDLEVIEALLPGQGSVLDLGAGVGRIADPLAQLGYQVTAVDDSADMLAHVRHARTVRARIEELHLPEKFDAVLLASNLISYPGSQHRRALLATAARHLKPRGMAIVQWRPPPWFTSRPPGRYVIDIPPVVQTFTVHAHRDGLVDVELDFACDGQRWGQRFQLERVTAAELRREFDRAALTLDTRVPEATDWLEAHA